MNCSILRACAASLLFVSLACGGSVSQPPQTQAGSSIAIAGEAIGAANAPAPASFENGMPPPPPPCTTDDDCTDFCTMFPQGCACLPANMGQICVPRCGSDADCPPAPGGMPLVCRGGGCFPF